MKPRQFLIALFALMVAAGPVLAQEGMRSVMSPHDVSTTLDKLQAALESKGMTIFQRVDHAEGAASVDLQLPPTALLIFGNPKVGTPLMQCGQSVAIDLPQKMLAWEDADGSVRLGWNDPAYLAGRHALEGCDEVLGKVAMALENFAKAATAE